jgi:hypothetical protein
MVRNILLGLAMLAGTAAAAHAAATDDVQAAAKKVADAGSYSWKSTIEGGFNGETDGKMLKDGLTSFKMTFGDNTTEAFKQGEKGAIKGEDGWKSFEEAANEGEGFARFMPRILQAYDPPASEAEKLAHDKDLKSGLTKASSADGDVYSGELSEGAAKALLSFGRRRGNGNNNDANNDGPQVKDAKGSVKFWVKDGQLVKLLTTVSGTVNFNGDDRDVNRTTTTEFSDVGSTKFDVPAEAKAKMK